ncbi:MAG: 7-cyano-7-deazaguanine synthase [Bacteroidales bacterium]|nr:7-cyano-7-deazaguanine synthase [Bacteroidales bacterium]
MNDKSGVLLASGGLDSTTLAYWLIKEGIDFVPLFIDYGQHCAKTELDSLKKVLPKNVIEKLDIINIQSLYLKSESRFIKAANLWTDPINADDLYIPYRNMLILTIGASYAQTIGVFNLYSAFINSNHAKEIDCTNDFFEKMESILGTVGAVKNQMPFRFLSKYEVAKIGIEVKAPIGLTFSCQASAIIPCGACPNCVDRLEALEKLQNDYRK